MHLHLKPLSVEGLARRSKQIASKHLKGTGLTMGSFKFYQMFFQQNLQCKLYIFQLKSWLTERQDPHKVFASSMPFFNPFIRLRFMKISSCSSLDVMMFFLWDDH